MTGIEKTVTYKILDDTLDGGKRILTGCQGIYESSNWFCYNCSIERHKNCKKAVNSHPDFRGNPL